MAKTQFLILCFGFLAVNIDRTQGITEEERKEMLNFAIPHLLECSTQYAISEDILKALQKDGSFEEIDTCFLSCFLKKANILDKEGKLDVTKSKELVRKYLSKEEDMKVFDGVIDECSAAANDKEVSDGDKGCDRVKLLIPCAAPHKKEIWSR